MRYSPNLNPKFKYPQAKSLSTWHDGVTTTSTRSHRSPFHSPSHSDIWKEKAYNWMKYSHPQLNLNASGTDAETKQITICTASPPSYILEYGVG